MSAAFAAGALIAALGAVVIAGRPAEAQTVFADGMGAPPSPPCVLDECLNRGAGPASEGSPDAPAASNSPPGPASRVAPGDFDFYVLALSWSPGFCDAGGETKAPDQCAIGTGLGFVVHGLWPQNAHGYPSDCDNGARPVSRAALAAAEGVFPSEGLARYEWRKHGACTGLAPQAFFASVRRARDSIAVPDAFIAPRREQSFAPIEIARAFIAVNAGLRLSAMAVTCERSELTDVRLCLAKDLRGFVDCPEVARRGCRSPSVNVAPIH